MMTLIFGLAPHVILLLIAVAAGLREAWCDYKARKKSDREPPSRLCGWR